MLNFTYRFSFLGLDFAHIINGYRYHTKFDSIEYIPRAVIQHTGENILELTKLMANSEELENTSVSNFISVLSTNIELHQEVCSDN